MSHTGMQARIAGIAIAVFTVGTATCSSLRPPVAALAATSAACGVERWDVKTLSDPDAPSVTSPRLDATVEDLDLLPLPGPIGKQTARYPVEKRIYKISALLREAKQEGDHDYHLVLVGTRSGATMVAEIPDPACFASQTPRPPASAIAMITQARTSFDRTFGPISDETAKGFTPMHDKPVTVVGVLFFDFYHGQTGCAKVPPNAPKPKACVELHPVLSIQSP